MAKASGSTRSSAPGRQQAATERGYSEQLEREILGMENLIRRRPDEAVYFFEENGRMAHWAQGRGAGVENLGATADEELDMINTIATHNHPRALNERGVKRIGNSFSFADLNSAVRYNLKEIRAVTPTYTFSVKRPASGWGVTQEQLADAYNEANQEVTARMQRYVDRVGTVDAERRAETAHFHLVMKSLSKKLGWNYTKKNS